MANAKTKVAFQRSATNARKMSNNFGKSVSQDDLVHHYWRPPKYGMAIMAKKVTVTKAQQAAAQYTLARSSKSGRSVPNAVRKIAGAERRRPPGPSQPPRTDDRLPAAPWLHPAPQLRGRALAG